jgi:type I restriction enzyme S subunit
MSDWKAVKISSFLKVRQGKYKPDDKAIANLKRLNKIDFSGRIHLSDKPTKTDMIIVNSGDLVISGINVAKGAIAVHQGLEPITATIHYSSYEFDESKIDINFLKRFLRSPAFILALKEQTRGGIKTEIKAKTLLSISVQLPLLLEQQVINSRFQKFENELVELDSEIGNQKNYLTKLRQAILQEAIEGKLTAGWRFKNPVEKGNPNTDAAALLETIKAEKLKLIAEGKIKKEKPLAPINPDDIPFSLPDSWVWARLGEVIISAKDGPHFSPKYSEKGVPFISTRNISTNGIDFTTAKHISEEFHLEISKKCKPEKDDVLYTKGGTTGIAVVNSTDIDFNVWVHVAVLKKSQNMYPYYIQHVLNSLHCYKQSQILTHGIGNQDLGLTRMVLITLPLPPLTEQHAIVERVDSLLAAVNTLEQQVKERKTYAEKLMQAVLKEAFAG